MRSALACMPVAEDRFGVLGTVGKCTQVSGIELPFMAFVIIALEA